MKEGPNESAISIPCLPDKRLLISFSINPMYPLRKFGNCNEILIFRAMLRPVSALIELALVVCENVKFKHRLNTRWPPIQTANDDKLRNRLLLP